MTDSINSVTGIIVDQAFKLHRDLGPGLLESVYESILYELLIEQGQVVSRQVPVPVNYGGKLYDHGFRADLVVAQRVIVELKSVEILAPVHYKQIQTYLKLTGFEVGLLINFNVPLIRHGIRRVVNNYHGPRVTAFPPQEDE